MKVYLQSCTEGYTEITDLLRSYAKMADPQKHQLSFSPDEADIILLSDYIDKQYGKALRQHPLVRSYPEKCFVIIEGNVPCTFLPGIYTNSRHTLGLRGRAGTSIYLRKMHHNDFLDAVETPLDRDLLFSFVGRNCHPVRDRLLSCSFTRKDIHIEDSSAYEHWHTKDETERATRQRHYVEIAKRSRFAICPRGIAKNSIRLYEMMQLGIAPVILSDGWQPPHGPDWKAFALFLPESRVSDLEAFLADYDTEWQERGERARTAWEEHFALNKRFNQMIAQCSLLKSQRKLPEAWVRRLWPLMIVQHKIDHYLGAIRRRLKL